MPKVLKFWHQWSWAFHILWMSTVCLTYIFDYKNAMANNTKDVAAIIAEQLPTRMATQEQAIRDIKEQLNRIEDKIP